MIRPLQDRVLVQRVDAEDMTASGIIIPDTAKEKPQEGEVVAVGRLLSSPMEFIAEGCDLLLQSVDFRVAHRGRVVGLAGWCPSWVMGRAGARG